MSLLEDVVTDLTVESDHLDALVGDLPDDAWRTPTPAPGWDVATQIAHLAWTDEAAYAAAADTERWDALVLEMLADPDHAVDRAALTGGIAAAPVLLGRWRTARTRLAAMLRACPPGLRIAWFGPPMSPTSMATARFMETWAHGLDVHAALGVEPAPTDRIRHVAHLGVRTRAYAYSLHGTPPPGRDVRVELTAPSGATWSWGAEDADQRVTGPALDFCLLVTRRVHRADTALVADGDDADRWLDIAQAFAGPPGEGRGPRGG
ncbi:MAG TPA: TIGR03084 family metal-binding protein [Nocardioides sp.]|jgi:uncharacterized protein (TIGR03084 family)|uniref:TIGR03084 family metal-binding protein n=1 Tax=Nocardioides sp. TaxID=35761 RepID=UPI002E36D4B4|nr:TIGR03084 family metal-binding protein [Nocardioides sp.]HEX3930228.1 TIGR03084 family metal-binding protein [Nocardioides sp.]